MLKLFSQAQSITIPSRSRSVMNLTGESTHFIKKSLFNDCQIFVLFVGHLPSCSVCLGHKLYLFVCLFVCFFSLTPACPRGRSVWVTLLCDPTATEEVSST